MTPLGEHQLLLLWVQLAALLTAARALGGLMRRIGQPPVVGELAAGLLIGPSVLGRLLPDVHSWLFPADPVQSGLLLAVAWVGIALLLVTIGFETDLGLLARLGWPALKVGAGSLVVPLAAAFALGFIVPSPFVGATATPVSFALFLSLAMSISALAIVGRILADMQLMRRNVGQVMIGGVVANDLVGWLLLGVLAGLVADARFDLVGVLVTVVSIAAFLALALTIGQGIVDRLLRFARHHDSGFVRSLTAVIAIALIAGALTQAIGVEAVFGAFVAGILIGRSRYQRPEVSHTLETVTYAFLAPLFFATAGLFVDLGLLADPQIAVWVALIIVVATVAKLAGSFAGARFGGLSPRESLAVGVGLNARGTLEIVVATVGLGLGVFNATSYSTVIVLAMATSMMVPPVLRAVLARLQLPPEEAARLERERMLDESVIANTRTALLPTRGGENSILAGRILDLSLQPEAAIAVYTVHRSDDSDDGRKEAEQAADELEGWFGQRRTERIERTADEIATAIRTEASLGYGVLAVGMTGRFAGAAPSAVLRDLLARPPAPVLLVRHGRGLDAHAETLRFRRIMVPAIGTRAGRAAQEIAYTFAGRVDGQVDAVHVVDRPDRVAWMIDDDPSAASAGGMLGEAESLAQQFGCNVNLVTRSGLSVGQELADAAGERDADLVILGAQSRNYSAEAYLGHTVEYVLQHVDATVLVVVLPAAAGD